jgi:hypothetical protein
MDSPYKKNISDLISKLNSNLNKISELKKLNPEKKIGFMLGTTITDEKILTPYPTPVRIYDNFLIFGAIVFDQTVAIILSTLLSSKVDYFFVDVEKKIPIDKNPNHQILKDYKIKFNSKDSKIEYGNLSKSIIPYVPKEKLIGYKANDLTVNAVWAFVSNHFVELSGTRIFVFGLGNIGCKLSLKLVESGANIFTYSNIKILGILKSYLLNKIKHKFVLSKITNIIFYKSCLSQSDCVIIASSMKDSFTSRMASHVKEKTLLIDISKGGISNDAIKILYKKNCILWRANITDYLSSYLSTLENLRKNLLNNFGEKKIVGIRLISGGFIGNFGDVVVDNFNNPSIFYGVCDGRGGFLSTQNKKYLKIIKLLKKYNLVG